MLQFSFSWEVYMRGTIQMTMIPRKSFISRKGKKRGLRGSKLTLQRRKASKASKPRTKLKSISKLIKEADRLFSLKTRGVCAGYTHEGESANNCFTCKKLISNKKLHCGHYLSRYYKSARWNFDNARPQCMMCNMWKRGDPIVFRQNLIKEIGEARVLAVEALRNAPLKLSREFLQKKIRELST